MRRSHQLDNSATRNNIEMQISYERETRAAGDIMLHVQLVEASNVQLLPYVKWN